jgi:hypothetical protein
VHQVRAGAELTAICIMQFGDPGQLGAQHRRLHDG